MRKNNNYLLKNNSHFHQNQTDLLLCVMLYVILDQCATIYFTNLCTILFGLFSFFFHIAIFVFVVIIVNVDVHMYVYLCYTCVCCIFLFIYLFSLLIGTTQAKYCISDECIVFYLVHVSNNNTDDIEQNNNASSKN